MGNHAHSLQTEDDMADEKKIQYYISVVKQTAMTGESVQVNTNLYEGATELELKDEILKISHAIQARTDEVNEKVLGKTAESLRKSGKFSEEDITRLCGEQVPYVE